MADLKIKMLVSTSDLQRVFEAASIKAKIKARNNFADLRPLVEESIDKAVKANQLTFIPNPEEIGELGVGEGGSPALRAFTAWKSLLASQNNEITTFSVRKKGTRDSTTIGEIRISISEEHFYLHPKSVIETESEELHIIPWMQWLILGETINGSHFTKDDTNGVSRTGRGVMLTKGVWSFQGRGEEVFGRILRQSRGIIGNNLTGLF